jgi:hypothetical protein
LRVDDSQTVLMPEGAEVLTVQAQRDIPCMWAMVDPSKPKVPRDFETFGTGHTIREDMGTDRTYVGTYQIRGGGLVFHVFERLS